MKELEVTSSVWDTGRHEFYCPIRERGIVRMTAQQGDKFLGIEYEKTGVLAVDASREYMAKQKLFAAMNLVEDEKSS